MKRWQWQSSSLLTISLVLLPACTSAPTEPAEVGAADKSQALRLIHLQQRQLDTLSNREAGWLCVDELQRVDYCAAEAMRVSGRLIYWFEEWFFGRDQHVECIEAHTNCEERFDTSAALRACQEAAAPPPGTCPVTVGQFQACLDAWAETQTCDNAGKLIETPAECVALRESCPSYADTFFQNGAPPSCEPLDEDEVPVDDNDDIYGLDPCRPIPDRFVVLGDSIATCYILSSHPSCSPPAMYQQLKETVAPDLVFEWYAVNGAVTADLTEQMLNVQPGPGHVAVWVYAIGNDLLSGNIDIPSWQASWQAVYDYFTDPALFPDGATFMLNTQYSPYDRCPDPPGDRTGIPIEDEDLLVEINQILFLGPAEARSDTVAIDQHADWLGHGQNADVGACPHCGVDNTKWMLDGIHPNDIGHQHIADKWAVAFELMYGADCTY